MSNSVGFALGSLGHALATYALHHDVSWQGFTTAGQRLLAEWITANRDKLVKLDVTDANTMVSEDDGIVVGTPYRLPISWKSGKSSELFVASTETGQSSTYYHAVLLDGKTVDIKRISLPDGDTAFRVRLDSGDWLWLFNYLEASPIELSIATENTLQKLHKDGELTHSGQQGMLVMPLLNLSSSIDPQELIGMHTMPQVIDESRIQTVPITNAFMRVSISITTRQTPITIGGNNADCVILNQPFRAAITRGESLIPLAVFQTTPRYWTNRSTTV